MAETVPVIDFSAYSLDREQPDPQLFAQLVENVHKALSTVGFMYLKNVGLPQTKIEHAFDISKRFFSLPADTKAKYYRNDEDWSGFHALEGERTNLERPHDLKEAFNYLPSAVYQQFPDTELPEFSAAITGLYSDTIPLHDRILEVMARGLKLEDPLYFVKRHQTLRTKGSGTCLRTLYYPPVTDTKPKEGQLRCGEHADFGGITLLFQDDQPGLEVLSVTDKWIPVPPIEGTVVVNMSELMQRWTADQYITSVHRVVMPTDPELLLRPRQSIAFFGYPDYAATIECVDQSNKYPPITGLQYMKDRLAECTTIQE